MHRAEATVQLASAMTGHLNRIRAPIAQGDRVCRIEHALDHQITGPLFPQLVEKGPVGACTAFGAVEHVSGQSIAAGKVAQCRRPVHQRGQRPARVQREIGEGARADPERHAKALLDLAGAAADFGDVDREHKGLIARHPRPLDQPQRAGPITAVVQLEPGPPLREGQHFFERAGGNGGDAERNVLRSRKLRQHPVGTGPGEVAHAHGRDAKGQIEVLS